MAQSPSIKREKWIRLSLTWLVVILVSVVIIYPLVWTVGASLNAGNSLLSTSIIPENVSFQHYADLFNGNVNYLTWYWNSMKISFLTMVLTLISVSFTAYAFSRFRFKGRQNGLMLFLLLQMIPQFSALIAIFVLSQLLGLINSHLALVLYAIAPIIITQYTFNFNNFNIIYLFNNGGPAVAGSNAGGTDILVSWIYKLTMSSSQYAIAATITILLSIFVVGLALWQFRATKSFKNDDMA